MVRLARYAPTALVAAVVIVLVTVVVIRFTTSVEGGPTSGYKLRIAMVDANQVYPGMPVWIKGLPVGKVSGLSAQGDTAMVTVDLRSGHEPMHTGTTAAVVWQSLLGQHYVQLTPGAATNPVLKSGSMIQSNEQVTVQDLINSLNAPTRQALAGTIQQLQAALSGHGQDLNATLQSAAPTVQAVNEVLDAVGQDGPALNQIVTKLHGVTSALVSRQDSLSSTVANLGQLTAAAAAAQTQLSDTLAQLPSTLETAKTTLNQIPSTASAVDPLLTTLQPAAAQLPSTATNLSPVLVNLTTALPYLDTTLDAANTLLNQTPTLLNNVTAVLPGLTKAVGTLQPALDFLRPYTPDVVAGASTFGDVFSGYDQNGHYARADLLIGPTDVGGLPTDIFNAFPGVEPRTAPGYASNENEQGTYTTDAYGSPES